MIEFSISGTFSWTFGITWARKGRFQMNMPVVSIILFAHAPYAKFIPDSLGSILGQSYTSLEVIVLGDGSKELQQALEPFREDSRLSSCSQGDKPFLQAANEKMKEARGEYLGTWNSDDFYSAD